MPPRWGWNSFWLISYKDAAPTALCSRLGKTGRTRHSVPPYEISDYDVAKSTFGTSRTDGGTLKKSPSDLKPNVFATRLLGKVSHLLR